MARPSQPCVRLLLEAKRTWAGVKPFSRVARRLGCAHARRYGCQSSPELIKQFLNDVPMQRFDEPEEIGELVLFICSDACEFMTADTVYVNGGGGWR